MMKVQTKQNKNVIQIQQAMSISAAIHALVKDGIEVVVDGRTPYITFKKGDKETTMNYEQGVGEDDLTTIREVLK